MLICLTFFVVLSQRESWHDGSIMYYVITSVLYKGELRDKMEYLMLIVG